MSRSYVAFFAGLMAALVYCAIAPAMAAADFDVSSPAIATLKKSMQDRHAQLAPLYASGTVVLRDANAVPLAQQQGAAALVAAENQDRISLYKEIARANGHPKWEQENPPDFRRTLDRKSATGMGHRNGKRLDEKMR